MDKPRKPFLVIPQRRQAQLQALVVRAEASVETVRRKCATESSDSNAHSEEHHMGGGYDIAQVLQSFEEAKNALAELYAAMRGPGMIAV